MANVRPTLVVGEGTTEDALPNEQIAEYALGSIAQMNLKLSNKFEDQFMSKYMPRIFPWALKYDCGGAEYPNLFGDWTSLQEGSTDVLELGVQQRWRRVAEAAVLTPGRYAQMLATRPEAQISGDWMLIPASRNLHWRHSVLHSSFKLCKQKIAPGESLNQNLEQLIEAAKKLWQRMNKNSVSVDGRSRPINGDMTMLCKADGLSSAEKVLLRSYLNVTKNIAGCQAIRRRIGHCLLGMRVVYGEVIFFTISPNRRHSSLLLKLARVRCGDASLDAGTKVSECRRRFCGKDLPSIFCDGHVDEDEDVETVTKEIQMPDIVTRQAMNAQDPLSSVHHYLVCAYVMLPSTFGLRMCLHCPHCNANEHNPNFTDDRELNVTPCQDLRGRNCKAMGGTGGMGEAMGMANEFQGDGTPHGHGFVALSNMYQHGSQ